MSYRDTAYVGGVSGGEATCALLNWQLMNEVYTSTRKRLLMANETGSPTDDLGPERSSKPQKRRKIPRRSYLKEEKLQVIEFYHASGRSLCKTRRKFAQNAKTVLRWVRNEDKIRQSGKGSKRVKYRSRAAKTGEGRSEKVKVHVGEHGPEEELRKEDEILGREDKDKMPGKEDKLEMPGRVSEDEQPRRKDKDETPEIPRRKDKDKIPGREDENGIPRRGDNYEVPRREENDEVPRREGKDEMPGREAEAVRKQVQELPIQFIPSRMQTAPAQAEETASTRPLALCISPTYRKRKSYTRETKLHVVDFYRTNGNKLHRTCKEFCLNRKTVLRWVRGEERIRASQEGSRHVNFSKRRSQKGKEEILDGASHGKDGIQVQEREELVEVECIMSEDQLIAEEMADQSTHDIAASNPQKSSTQSSGSTVGLKEHLLLRENATPQQQTAQALRGEREEREDQVPTAEQQQEQKRSSRNGHALLEDMELEEQTSPRHHDTLSPEQGTIRQKEVQPEMVERIDDAAPQLASSDHEKKRKSYSREAKLKVVEFYKANGRNLCLTCKNFSQCNKTVLRWVRNEEKIRNSKEGSRHVRFKKCQKIEEQIDETKRKSYSREAKLKVVEFYKANGRNLCLTCKNYSLCNKTVLRWVRKEEKIRNSKEGSRHVRFNKHQNFPGMEQRLYAEYKELHDNGVRMTRSWFFQRAREILQQLGTEADISLTYSWLDSFKANFCISLPQDRQAATSASQEESNDGRTVSFDQRQQELQVEEYRNQNLYHVPFVVYVSAPSDL